MGRPLQLGALSIEVEDAPTGEVDAMDSDWTQTEVYGRRFWDDTFTGMARRLSVESHHTSLITFTGWDRQSLPDLLRFLPLVRSSLAVTRLVSDQPLLDGFLTCLVFRHSREHVLPVPLDEVIEAFVRSELEREPTIEDWIQEFHGDIEPDFHRDRVLWQVDYPRFGSGSLGIGFGLLVDDAFTVRVWSRAVHYHK